MDGGAAFLQLLLDAEPGLLALLPVLGVVSEEGEELVGSIRLRVSASASAHLLYVVDEKGAVVPAEVLDAVLLDEEEGVRGDGQSQLFLHCGPKPFPTEALSVVPKASGDGERRRQRYVFLRIAGELDANRFSCFRSVLKEELNGALIRVLGVQVGNELAVSLHTQSPVVHSQTAADGVEKSRLSTTVLSHNAVQLPRKGDGQLIAIGLEIGNSHFLQVEGGVRHHRNEYGSAREWRENSALFQ